MVRGAKVEIYNALNNQKHCLGSHVTVNPAGGLDANASRSPIYGARFGR